MKSTCNLLNEINKSLSQWQSLFSRRIKALNVNSDSVQLIPNFKNFIRFNFKILMHTPISHMPQTTINAQAMANFLVKFTIQNDRVKWKIHKDQLIPYMSIGQLSPKE